MKLPVKTGPSRKDTKNGGEYRVLMDSAGEWLADLRLEHAEQIVSALNASPSEAEGEAIALLRVWAKRLEYSDPHGDYPKVVAVLRRNAPLESK